MDLTGAHVSALSSHMIWDSLPLNWLLFRLQRKSVPAGAGDRSVVLADLGIDMPPQTKAAMSMSVFGKLFAIFTSPGLLMTEVLEEKYSLGSAWAFLGGLPVLEGMSTNTCFKGFKRMRFLMYSEDTYGHMLMTNELDDGRIAFLKITELDERSLVSQFGTIDQEKQTISMCIPISAWRSCRECVQMSRPCDLKTCFEDAGNFEVRRGLRKGLVVDWDQMGLSLRYFEMWMGDTWTHPAGPLNPYSVTMTFSVDGSLIENAQLSVLQDSLVEIHPARSSYRMVNVWKKQMDSQLSLDEHVWKKQMGSQLSLDEHRDESSSEVVVDLKLSGLVCELCNTRFATNYNLKRHKRTVHERKKGFACTLCKKTYSQNGHLKEHVRLIHTGENLFACTVCSKHFGSKSKLDRHAVTVHGSERSFQCYLCSKRYKEKSSLKQHQAKHHKTWRKEKLSR
ncbi:hypothetical protein NDN08_007190 [Rhodosorus marinus]|uniref:C2H2-type domain-containing protein n=1 Tax=Rhodosorus marinus TaxID=101924 RepID=A0AAV8UH98_9RHOD|nr:hypothetical protein NDN08_007190 [Rhodosorus marinus]